MRWIPVRPTASTASLAVPATAAVAESEHSRLSRIDVSARWWPPIARWPVPAGRRWCGRGRHEHQSHRPQRRRSGYRHSARHEGERSRRAGRWLWREREREREQQEEQSKRDRSVSAWEREDESHRLRDSIQCVVADFFSAARHRCSHLAQPHQKHTNKPPISHEGQASPGAFPVCRASPRSRTGSPSSVDRESGPRCRPDLPTWSP